MAGDLLFRKPSLAVVQGDSEPMYGVVGAAATVTYLVPGKLVVNLTNDGEVDVAGTADASNNVGIAGYEYTPDEYRPATRDTAYAVGDHIAVHNKPGMRFRGFLQPGSTAVAPGDRLYHPITDSSGNFALFAPTLTAPAADGAHQLAKALETITPADTTATACWMQWL
jgi:hypothetical protein